MPVAPGVQDYLQGRELCGGASLYRHHWRGSIPTAIELGEFRQDRSADFSPLPAVLGAPELGGLKSALLNSMPGLLGPLPARASLRERVANPVSWWRYQDAPLGDTRATFSLTRWFPVPRIAPQHPLQEVHLRTSYRPKQNGPTGVGNNNDGLMGFR